MATERKRKKGVRLEEDSTLPIEAKQAMRDLHSLACFPEIKRALADAGGMQAAIRDMGTIGDGFQELAESPMARVLREQHERLSRFGMEFSIAQVVISQFSWASKIADTWTPILGILNSPPFQVYMDMHKSNISMWAPLYSGHFFGEKALNWAVQLNCPVGGHIPSSYITRHYLNINNGEPKALGTRDNSSVGNNRHIINEINEYAEKNDLTPRELLFLIKQFEKNGVNKINESRKDNKGDSDVFVVDDQIDKLTDRGVQIVDEGGLFRVDFMGKSMIFPKLKGMKYLKLLTDYPYKSFSVVAMREYCEGEFFNCEPAIKNFSPEFKELERLNNRLVELEGLIEEAASHNDEGQKLQFELEKDSLQLELEGKGCRNRRLAADNPEFEKARKSVRENISRVLEDKIRPVCPELEEHFRANITLGLYCNYNS